MEKFDTDLKYKMNSIKTPTLIIWGKDDEASC